MSDVSLERNRDSARRTMSHALVAGVVFVRHRSLAVSEHDWQRLLDDIASVAGQGGTVRVLVKTDDAGPNPSQRNRLHLLVKSRNAKLIVAVMSGSLLIRGMVTALSWMRTLEIRSFGEVDYAPALEFLDARQLSIGLVLSTFAQIDRSLG